MNAIGSAADLQSAQPAAAPRRKRRLPPRGLLVLAAALVVGGGGFAYLHAARASATTDNAYVKTDVTIVAPRVRGHVAEVLVSDNQPVKAGQILVRLDPEEYAARVAAAEGDLAIAVATVAAAEASLVRLGSEEAAAAAQVRESETTIRAADAESRRAEADRQRYAALLKTGYAPRRDAERIDAQAVAATAAADRSRAGLTLSRNQLAAVSSRRGELVANVAQARALQEKAAAALDLARQDRDHAVIRAPIDGVVGDRQANVGDYVQPGMRLLVLNPLDRLYLTANFKETQTARMLRGQAARVKIDALPGVTFKAHVDSFAPGTGSEFALLPFEPGVGNFTKIVQRVPVKLRFDPGQPDLSRLRPGLSAKVTVVLDGA
ncbi:MAG: HlyD family efflux transporter periplasmic adaptor subunit [Phenylobacterium sp.]|uniref:HlyD family secretion protein n=1 Tax=Phenylobacterium sp. TaxID=1871053 RepID=UPI0025E12BE6|nr:HlyD family secretion protein [Phenylobacterium sp.]MBI1196715.1 HlyD family efflux transporter periplasmic adaptor subunit [Phenylobacterium sp.]